MHKPDISESMNKQQAIQTAERNINIKQEKKEWYLCIHEDGTNHRIQLLDKRSALWLSGLYKIQMTLKLMKQPTSAITTASLQYSNYEDYGRMWTRFIP